MKKSAIESAIEDVYQDYPMKVHKSEGMKKLAKSVKTKEDVDLLKESVRRYNKFMEEEAFKGQAYLHWSTFCGRWRDWAEYEPSSKKSRDDQFERLRIKLGVPKE